MNERVDDLNNLIGENYAIKREDLINDPVSLEEFIKSGNFVLENREDLENVMMVYFDYVKRYNLKKDEMIVAFSEYIKDFYTGNGEGSYDEESNPEPMSYKEFLRSGL